LELSKTKDEAVVLNVKNKNLEEEKNTLETKLEDNKLALKKAKYLTVKLSMEWSNHNRTKTRKEISV